ncbi:Fungal specific transcription factor domain [Geosmithia morbida]|uniref:Fungal specific transcription factor domain n=1 Tax=Geosmithia morbida TaxID=1094350 RepID=A0A9P4YYG3_9HYPO|nr:Fungal specific transcription factor domain [Geosmithia morbida]KAF4124360.1 Fungal specific transcription factor domain [Geosmithia morbida]
MAHISGSKHLSSSSSSSTPASASTVQRTAPIPIAPKPPSRPDSSSTSASASASTSLYRIDSSAAAARRLDVIGGRPASASNSKSHSHSLVNTSSYHPPGAGTSNSSLSNLLQASRGVSSPSHPAHAAAAAAAAADRPASSAPASASAPLPPCRACRQAGSRCIPSEDDDGCISCQVNAHECSLSLSPPSSSSRKRKLFPGEDRLSSSSPGGTLPRRQIINNSSSNGQHHQQHHHHHHHHHNSNNNNNSSLSSTAASSSFLEDMANVGGPTMLKRTLGLQQDRFSQYIGPTTDFEPSLINLSSFDPQGESLLSRGTLRKVSDDDTFLMLPDGTTPGHEHLISDLDDIEAVVAPHGRKLIDLYFRIIHPAFPIVQKHVFIEKYDRSYREFDPPVLAAVYLLAINWWEHHDDLVRVPRPNVRHLERLVRTTLADAIYRPKLSTVQAGLLLSQRPEGDQWAPTAQVVATAQELGLHLDCSGWKIPPWEKGLRKRLAWALYMQDKWGALVHGRPSHIFPSNWGVRSLTSNDFPDVEWDEDDVEEKQDIERGRLVFTRAVQLSEVLAEILETFYTLDAAQTVADAGAQGTQVVLSLAKPIQLKLKEWYGNLPNSIRIDSTSSLSATASASGASTSTSSLSSRFTSIGYLHLAYFAAEITLHRRIIRSLAATATATDPYVQSICRSAAKARLISAMDFVNRLGPIHLRSFWYFASKTNFALIGTFGSLLWATSPGREEAEWYRRRLSEYRWTLSVSSKPGEGRGLTEFAMTMLDISTGLLDQLPEKPSMSRNGSMADFAGAGPGGPGGLGGPAGPPSMSMLDTYAGIHSHSALPSGVQSPQSTRYSSDDDMDDYPDM